jgi:heme/copper-type cytochrome/quinol oxidase subunit 4
MDRQNQKNISLKNEKLMKRKINGNRFSYLGVTAITLSVFLTISLSTWLAVGQSVAYNPLAREAKEGLILVQQESPTEEAQPEESPTEEAQPEESLTEEAQPEESPTEEVQPEESPTEEAQPEESPTEEAQPEESPTEEAQPEESPTEEAQPEKELSLEETKKSLEEEINERYEEWDSQRIGSEISHSISAIATIVMTVFLALLGTGFLALPYRRLIIIILAVITVLIQLNINIFLLEKSLGGYTILEEQGLILKNKLKTASTDEELTEIREQFEELVLESIEIE